MPMETISEPLLQFRRELVISTTGFALLFLCHLHRARRVRRSPPAIAIGITNHARLTIFGPAWMLVGTVVLIAILHNLDRKA